MTNNFSLLLNDDNKHSLLEPPAPAYSNMTVKRAFIVWLHCGQLNEYKSVCNYYHCLEALEEELSLEERVKSRLHEFNLLSSTPPTSTFLKSYFPDLYTSNQNIVMDMSPLDHMNFDDCVFDLQGFHKLKNDRGLKAKDIMKTSQMIRKYCETHSKSLRYLLRQFRDYAKKCKLEKSINNISIYIKKKYLKDELATYKNIPKTFAFLDTVDVPTVKKLSTIEEVDEVDEDIVQESAIVDADINSKVIKSPSKIKILITDARKEELINVLPDASNLPDEKIQNKKNYKANFISSMIMEDRMKHPMDKCESVNNI